jgi:hypothetical protein
MIAAAMGSYLNSRLPLTTNDVPIHWAIVGQHGDDAFVSPVLIAN